MAATTGIPDLDATLNKLDGWLNDVMDAVHTARREEAYAALHATLPALRDHLAVDEAAQLAAQLPIVVRGLYYDGWDPSRTPVKERHVEAFLDHVGRALDNRINLEPEAVARGVFAVLAKHVTEGEIDDVLGRLPAELRALWPAESR